MYRLPGDAPPEEILRALKEGASAALREVERRAQVRKIGYLSDREAERILQQIFQHSSGCYTMCGGAVPYFYNYYAESTYLWVEWEWKSDGLYVEATASRTRAPSRPFGRAPDDRVSFRLSDEERDAALAHLRQMLREAGLPEDTSPLEGTLSRAPRIVRVWKGAIIVKAGGCTVCWARSLEKPFVSYGGTPPSRKELERVGVDPEDLKLP